MLRARIVAFPGCLAADFAMGKNYCAGLTDPLVLGANGGSEVRTKAAKPGAERPFSTVIMVHRFLGLNASLIGRADLLATQGYFGIAPDTLRDATTPWAPRAISLENSQT